MSEGAVPNVAPQTTQTPAPAQPAPQPQSQSVSPSAGGGPAPATPAPVAQQPQAPQHQDMRVGLDHRIQVDLPDGNRIDVPLKDLVNSHRQFQKVKDSGYELFDRAMKGDVSAAQEYLNRFGGSAPAPTPGVSQPQPSGQPQSEMEARLKAMEAQLRDATQITSQYRQQQITNGLNDMLKNEEFSALRQRPDAVEYILKELDLLVAQGQQVNANVVSNLARVLNQKEATYQENLLKPLKERMGELGVDDPFRGGTPQAVTTERPDHTKDPEAYKAWARQKLRAAMFQDSVAAG